MLGHPAAVARGQTRPLGLDLARGAPSGAPAIGFRKKKTRQLVLLPKLSLPLETGVVCFLGPTRTNQVAILANKN